MDRNKAHDILHVWNSNKSETCPVCNGTMTSDEEIIAAAKDVAAENYHPRINPALNDPLYCDENGKPIDKPAPTAAEKPQDAAPTITAGESKTPEKKDEKPATPPAPQSVKMSELKTCTDVMSFSEDGTQLPKTIKIIPTGIFKTQAYGDVTITKDDLMEMAKNFSNGVRAGVPIDIDHDQKAAAGWINGVQVYDDGMYADVEWTPLGVDKLTTKEYRFFSPEFSPQYIDPEHSIEMSNVLIAGSLVNRPMFKELPAIAGSEDGGKNLTNQNGGLMLLIQNTKDTQNNAEIPASDQSDSSLEANKKEEKPMDLQTILAKEKSTRTSDEQTFVAQSLSQLTDEQKVAEGFVVAASEEKKGDTPADEANKGDKTIEAKEKADSITISASEYQTLKAGSQKGELAFKELEKKEITEAVRGLQFNEKGGKFAPAQGDQLINLMVKMSEPDRAELTKILKELPDRKIFGEMGSDDDLDKSKAADLLTAKANELVKTSKESGTTLSFSEALKRVSNENPDLYRESLKGANAN